METHLRHIAIGILHLALGFIEGGFKGFGDLDSKGRIRAAGFADKMHVIRHNIGCIAGGLAILAAKDTDIRRTLAFRLHHLAKPAGTMRFREPDGGHER